MSCSWRIEVERREMTRYVLFYTKKLPKELSHCEWYIRTTGAFTAGN